MKKLSAIIFSLSVLLMVTTSCGSGEGAVWKTVKSQYLQDSLVQQLILVKCTTGSQAEVELYCKKDGSWSLVESGPAHIGKQGLGKEKEGDQKTPEGEFGIRTAFGILPNPGTAIPYLDVTPDLYACYDDGPYYNQIISITGTDHQCTGEHMIEYTPHYNYGMETTYNAENIYPKGSAIFFHCVGPKDYTQGCVAVEEPFMKHILQLSDKHLIISIHQK